MRQIDQSLYICSTYYHVYVTLLKRMVIGGPMDLVVCDDIPTGPELCQRLRESGLFGRVWYIEQSKLPREWGKNLIDWIFFQKKRRLRAIAPLLPFRVWDYENVYIYHDGTPLGMHLIDAKKPYHLIEDSLNFYQRFEKTPQAAFLKRYTWKYRLRKLMGWGYFSLGDSPYTLDVEVNENKELQLSRVHVVELSRTALRLKLNNAQAGQMVHLFGVPPVSAKHGETALLLTQPLFLDGVCDSEGTQFDKYKEIAADLHRQGYEVIVKPHPRDTVDYTQLGLPVLERTFPVELLEYIVDGGFGCAATVSSSAVYSVLAKRYARYF